MSSPALSQSLPPSRPSISKLQAQCVSTLSEITDQLLNEDAAVRFQCLAYFRYGRSPILRRCEGSCEIQSRPQVFERAKQILQQKRPVTFVDYVGAVVRILFCKTHSEANAFRKYHDLFQQHWKGDGTPKELELLEAIRQAYQLSPVHSAHEPNIIESSFISSNPSTTKPQAESSDPNVQLNTLLVPPYTGRVAGAPPGQCQPMAVVGLPSAQRRHLIPTPPSQHMRNRSNPPPQRNETSLATEPSAHTAAGTAGDSAIVQSSPYPSGIPSGSSFEFRYPAPNIRFSLRQVRDETPNPHSTLSASVSSNHEPYISLSQIPVPPEQVSDTPPEVISTSSLSDSPRAITHNQIPFLPTSWDSCDFSSSFHPSGLRGSSFKPTAMARKSKDDTFVEQLSSTAASTAPTLFQAPMQHSIPEPEPNNGPDKDVKPFIPVCIDGFVREAVMKPVTKEGYVYILKSPKFFEENYPGEPPRVKIGISVDVKSRISDLKNNCGLFDLERVEDREDIPHRWYYKVEELVHSELANFKRELKCGKCRTRKGEESAHREWFVVPEAVALETVQRWRKFILTEPYDENGILTDHWSEMLTPKNIIWQTREEEYDDHEKRQNRWNRWLEEGIKAALCLK